MIVTIQKEETFNIIQNEEGCVGLVIWGSQASKPSSPRFVYDGGDNLLLLRNFQCTLAFDHISPFARRPLKESAEVLVTEFDDDEEFQREYVVPVVHVLDIQPYMFTLEKDWYYPNDKGKALEININEKQMEQDEAAYYIEKQARLDRLIGNILRFLSIL